jgi:hypothetical protein
MAAQIRAEESERLGELLKPRLVQAYGRWEAASGSAHDADAWYAILVRAVQLESSTLEQTVALCEFALASDRVALANHAGLWTKAAHAAWDDPYTGDVLRRCLDTLEPEHLATPDAAARYFQALRHYFRETAGVRGQRVMSAVRAVLTGSMTGPCLGIVASLLGWQRCVERIRNGLP